MSFDTWELTASDESAAHSAMLATAIDAADELLPTVNQIAELWVYPVMSELTAATAALRRDRVELACERLRRVKQLQRQWSETMAAATTLPSGDSVWLRDRQGVVDLWSQPYCLLELTLGHKDSAAVEHHRRRGSGYAKLRAALRKPSFYDECLLLLARRGFWIPLEKVSRDWSEPYSPDESVSGAWRQILTRPKTYPELHSLAELLLEMDEGFHALRLPRRLGHHLFPELSGSRALS